MAHRPIKLGQLLERGLDVLCWCNLCCHNGVVATGQLIARLGPDTPVPEAGRRMRCSRCGGRDVATRPDWPTLGRVARHTNGKNGG